MNTLYDEYALYIKGWSQYRLKCHSMSIIYYELTHSYYNCTALLKLTTLDTSAVNYAAQKE